MLENHSFWLNQSSFTDPYGYSWMYADVPDTIPEICEVIHNQLIHIVWAEKVKNEINREINREDFQLPTVAKMLEALHNSSAGTLLKHRTPNQRIIVTCRSYALLLASILKHKGIPCRLRVGFAHYLMNNGNYIDHWIVEYWDKHLNAWRLADPDAKISDMTSDEFLTAGAAWLKVKNKLIDPKRFGWGQWWGMDFILNNLCCDLLCVTGNEVLYEARVKINKGFRKIDKTQIEMLDNISNLLIKPEENINNLFELSKTKDFLIT